VSVFRTDTADEFPDYMSTPQHLSSGVDTFINVQLVENHWRKIVAMVSGTNLLMIAVTPWDRPKSDTWCVHGRGRGDQAADDEESVVQNWVS